jgi:hypothetical protein
MNIHILKPLIGAGKPNHIISGPNAGGKTISLKVDCCTNVALWYVDSGS